MWTGDAKQGYDVAILRLCKAVNGVAPTLAAKGTEILPGTILFSLGWGEGNEAIENLQIATSLEVVANEHCPNTTGITDDAMCTFSNYQDACSGALLLFVSDGNSAADSPLYKSKVAEGDIRAVWFVRIAKVAF